MKFSTTAKSAVAAAGIAVIAISTAGPASAYSQVKKFGDWQWLVQENNVTAWQIMAPHPSSDTIPDLPLAGLLWEANATVKAKHGTITPIIPSLNGRTDRGVNYQVLWQAFAPNGISGATLADGEQSTGKIYFDVTDGDPTRVMYNNGVEDLLIWEK